VKRRENMIKWSIAISLKNKTKRNNNDCNILIRRIVDEKPKNFHRINSYLFIGFERIRKIVFPSISLNKS